MEFFEVCKCDTGCCLSKKTVFLYQNMQFLKKLPSMVASSRRVVVVVVTTLPLPRDGGTARTAIQVHAVNLIEIRLEER